MALFPLHRKPTQKIHKLELLVSLRPHLQVQRHAHAVSKLISLPWVVLVCAALQVVLVGGIQWLKPDIRLIQTSSQFAVANRDLDMAQRSPSNFFCNISHPEP